MGRVYFLRVRVEYEYEGVEYGPSTSLRVPQDSLQKKNSSLILLIKSQNFRVLAHFCWTRFKPPRLASLSSLPKTGSSTSLSSTSLESTHP